MHGIHQPHNTQMTDQKSANDNYRVVQQLPSDQFLM